MNEVREISKPWEGSGVEVIGSDSIESVVAKSELGWKVDGYPLLVPVGAPDNFSNLVKIATHKAIIRVTDGMQMGIVGINWNILQNSEVFQFIDELVQLGLVKYHSAGQFKGGKIVWVQAEFQESEILPGDVHKKYLLLTNAFDGTFSVRICWTDVRVACWNTLIAALRGARNGFAIKHTASMRDKISDAKQALIMAEDESRQFDMFQKALTRLQMTPDMWKTFAHELMPNPEEGKNKTRAENARENLITLSVVGRGQEIAGVQGTAYAALNALTEYVNYDRTSRGKSTEEKQAGRYQAALFGSGAKLVNQGLTVLNGFLVDNNIQV